MSLREADTRAKLIDPQLYVRGWTEELIRREETAGAVEIVGGQPRRQPRGRVDYTLRVKVNSEAPPLAVALLEAKAEHLPPGHGLEQAKGYAECKRLNVPSVFASNGHLLVELDRTTGLTSDPRPLDEFPTPGELRGRYEQGVGFSLTAPLARPLLARYRGGEATRRYYQDAAIRAVLEHIARGEKRALQNAGWLAGLPATTRATLRALAGQSGRGGTEGLENAHVFQTPEAMRAGGLAALKALGRPADVLRETKERIFTT